MDFAEALQLLIKLIKDGDAAYHPHYKRTVKLADEYTALITGEGLNKMLKKHATRESPELFQQRKDLTEHITVSVCKNLMDVLFKVPRSNALKRVVTYDQADEKANQLIELNKILGSFWGEDELDKYFATRFIQLMCIDPNAFVVVEFKPFDYQRERAKPYPFEVFSEDAIHYRYENKVLQHLAVKTKFGIPVADGFGFDGLAKTRIEDGERFTLYLPNESIVLQEINEDSESIKDAKIFQEETIFTNSLGERFIKIGKRYFRLITPKAHNAGRVPAFKVGYVPDLTIKAGGYALNPFWAAVPYLKKTLKVNSELDLTMSNSAFPLPVRYAAPCTAQSCKGGTLPNGGQCGRCKGSGFEPKPTSVQEEILIALPKDPADMIDLDKILAFKAPPVEILKFQAEYVEELTRKAKQIVFNSDVFSRKEIAETATGKNIDLQNVYDALFPLAEKYSSVWVEAVKLCANFSDLKKGLIVSLSFGKDFKLKSLEDLIADLERANNSGASSELIRQINQDIIAIIHENRPIERRRYEIIEGFNPFSGKSSEEIISFISMGLVPRKYAILYANFGVIFDELELSYGRNGKNFYDLKPYEQKDAIYLAVDEMIAQLEAETPSPSLEIPNLQ